jgi:6,7-dimethyl-8-ribityllumazine synthase
MTNIVAVCAMYHTEEIERMLTIATSQAEDLDLIITDVVRVQGCMEIPLALDRVLSDEEVAGAFCLGIIEKGETDHGLAMGQAVVKTILELQLVHDKPIGLGIIGPGAKPEHIGPRLGPHATAAVDALMPFL